MKTILFFLSFAAAAAAAEPAGSFHAGLLSDAKDALVRADGKAPDASVFAQKKYLFIYFSAHWCPPCRAFTPKLVDFYNQNVGNGDFELVFVSSDKSEEAMEDYMADTKMPWSGLKLGSAPAKLLKQRYAGRGIPCLVLLDENNQVLASSYKDGKYIGPEAAIKAYQALRRKAAQR